ncbi:ABC transporter ATP-binding protein [Nocardioides sp. 1609]|uniref:ABC transporter transmembrane domain-containing protein n=1 Tax=Nocardioides sp. 1609 TaxID=2508327 RepID=UPI00106FE5D1|nr:ABC transporter ATP-binding protein [Nocardioides sp. 1609]
MSDVDAGEALRRLMAGHSRTEKRSLVLYALLSSISAIGAASQPWLIGQILEAALESGTARLTWLVSAMAVVIGVGIACNVSRHVVAERVKLRLAADLRVRVGAKAARAASDVAGHTSPAHVATVASSDVERVSSYPVARIRLLSSVLGMAVVVAYMMTISPLLAVLVVVGVPAFIWLTARIAEPLEERQDKHRDSLGTVTALSADISQGLRILRGLRAEGVARARLDIASRATEVAGVRVARIEALLLVSGQLLPGLFLTLLIWVSSHLAASGQLSAASLVTVYAASGYLFLPISAAVDFLGTRSGARVAARRTVQVLDAPVSGWAGSLAPIPSAAVLTDTVTGIRIQPGGLSVVVSGEPESLARRLTALSLESGRLDDTALRDFDLAALRASLRYQGARSTMFSGTVRELLDPRGSHADAELEDVLRVAGADDVVARLDGGLDAQVYADGRSVSGGQRQRLALARALLGGPSYLVLVEPTTALDAATEVKVAARVAEYRKGRTTVVFARGGAFRAVADHQINVDDDAAADQVVAGGRNE